MHPGALVPLPLVFAHDDFARASVLSLLRVALFDLKVDIEVPSSLVSSTVRFKWKQENFENALEFWALDNVQVRMNLLDGGADTR